MFQCFTGTYFWFIAEAVISQVTNVILISQIRAVQLQIDLYSGGVRTSVRTLAILRFVCGFTQSVEENAGIIPLLGHD